MNFIFISEDAGRIMFMIDGMPSFAVVENYGTDNPKVKDIQTKKPLNSQEYEEVVNFLLSDSEDWFFHHKQEILQESV